MRAAKAERLRRQQREKERERELERETGCRDSRSESSRGKMRARECV